MKKIKASNIDREILVDDEDYERVSVFTWRIYKPNDLKRGNYAVRTINWYEGEKRRQKLQYLHHFIIGRKDGMLVDHINRNTLDNRKENLRHCTHSQNQANSTSSRSASGHRGVTWHKKDKKYRARIGFNNKRYDLGGYETIEEASIVYKQKRAELLGEFAPKHLIN